MYINIYILISVTNEKFKAKSSKYTTIVYTVNKSGAKFDQKSKLALVLFIRILAK